MHRLLLLLLLLLRGRSLLLLQRHLLKCSLQGILLLLLLLLLLGEPAAKLPSHAISVWSTPKVTCFKASSTTSHAQRWPSSPCCRHVPWRHRAGCCCAAGHATRPWLLLLLLHVSAGRHGRGRKGPHAAMCLLLLLLLLKGCHAG